MFCWLWPVLFGFCFGRLASMRIFNDKGYIATMNNSQLINQTSGLYEYYTPLAIIEAARKVLGTIELDPASSANANKTVRAIEFFDEAKDGLQQTWFGNVWMNHPFSRENNPKWINKLLGSYKAGTVESACCITYACTSEKWFQPLMGYPQCYLSPRTNYLLPDGTVKRGVTKGSVVTYFGDSMQQFCNAFEDLGNIMLPHSFLLAVTPGNDKQLLIKQPEEGL